MTQMIDRLLSDADSPPAVRRRNRALLPVCLAFLAASVTVTALLLLQVCRLPGGVLATAVLLAGLAVVTAAAVGLVRLAERVPARVAAIAGCLQMEIM